MKLYIRVFLMVLAVGLTKSYVISPDYTEVEKVWPIDSSDVVETSLLREKRSPQGSVDFTAGVGPGKTGTAGLGYNHQVWKGSNGQSLQLGGNYNGQFGNGKPQHNFGVGGTFKF